MTKITVLHLITELNVGGAEKSLAHLLAHLDRDRFSPTVACLYGGDGPIAGEIRAMNIPVIDLGVTAKWRWDGFWRLYDLLRRECPTILHTWMFHANIPGRVLGRLAGVPIVINSEHTMAMERGWRYWLNRITHPWTDQVICVSPQVADFFVDHVGIPRQKIIFIPNGVDLQNLKDLPDKLQARARLALPPDQVLVGTVARLDPVKRLDVLLQALTSLSDVSAVVVGDGPERVRLGEVSDRLKLTERVFFVGHQEDVWPWLAALDVFVLCSDWEGMSNALLEGMAAGLPVVATAVGGTPDVVVDGVTGLLVPPRDPPALAEAVVRLLRDPDLRHRMGEAGRHRVEEHFSLERMVGRTQALYQQLLDAKGLKSGQG